MFLGIVNILSGQEMVIKASDSPVKFGDTGAHLKLKDSLETMPDTVEAMVSMESEWTILKADGSMAGLTVQSELTDVPDETLNYAGKTIEAGEYFSFKNSFDVNIPEIYDMDDVALEFWFYNPNEAVTVGTYGENQLELTSSGTHDNEEIRWMFNSDHMGFQKGWNHIYLPLSSYMYQTGVFDFSSVNFIRLYGVHNTQSTAVNYIISDIKLVICQEAEKEEWVVVSKEVLESALEDGEYLETYITTSGDTTNHGTNDGPQAGMTVYNLSKEAVGYQHATPFDLSSYGAGRLAISFWIYSSVELTSGVLELTSSGTMDSNEVCWYLKDMEITPGQWNYIELPLASGTTRGTAIDVANINYFRYHSLTQATNTTIRISEITLFAPDEIVYPAYETNSTDVVTEYTGTDTDVGEVPTTDRKFYKIANSLSGKVWKQSTGTIRNGATVTNGTPCSMNFSDYDRKDVALSFWYYTSGTTFSGRIELTSAATIAQSSENARVALQFNQLEATKGWHYVEVPLDNSNVSQSSQLIVEKDSVSTDNIVFDMSNIDYLRIYFNTQDEGTIIISDITLKLSDAATESGTLGTVGSVLQPYATGNVGTPVTKETTINDESISDGVPYSLITVTENNNPNVTCALLNTVVDVEAYDESGLALSFWIHSEYGGNLPNGQIEVSSSLNADKQEKIYNTANIALEPGWNHILLPFSLLNTNQNNGEARAEGYDYTAIKRVRFYIAAGENYNREFGITDFQIVPLNEICTSEEVHKTTDSIVFSNVSGDLDDGSYELSVSKEGYPTLVYGRKAYTLEEDIRTGEAVTIRIVSRNGVISFYKDGTLCAARSLATDATVDVKKNYCIAADAGGKICLSLYVEDATRLRTDTNCDFVAIELGSAGKCDYNEYEWRVKNSDLVTGWNDLELSFSDVYRVQNNTTPDWKNINWFRIYGSVTEAVVVKVDNVYAQNSVGKKTILSCDDTDNLEVITATGNTFSVENGAFQCKNIAGDLQQWWGVTMEQTVDISNYAESINRMYGSIGSVSVSAGDDILGAWTMTGDIEDTSMNIEDTSGNGNTAVWYSTDTFTSEFYTNASEMAANGNRPEKAGYVFAGWYSAASCKRAEAYRAAGSIPSTGAYAKFVDDLILSVKAQAKLNPKTKAVGASTDIRFVTTLDSLDYGYVGFKIQINGGNVFDYEAEGERTYNVYTSLTYVSDDAGTLSVTPSEVCAPKSLYFKACTLTDFLFNSDYDVEVTVTPYWETLDGTTVLGTASTYCVNDLRGGSSSQRRILVASDIHLTDKAYYGVSDEIRVQKFIDDLKAEYEKEPFEELILLGDYSLDYWVDGGTYCQNGQYGSDKVSTTKTLYDTYLSQLKDLNIPIYMIAGNHEQYVESDNDSDILSWYDITSQKRTGYTVCGDYLFIMSDTYQVTSVPTTDNDGTYTPADVNYIQSIMDKYPEKKVFLCAHYFNESKESEAFNTLIDDERVLGLVAGHIHRSTVEAYGNKKILYTGNYSYHRDDKVTLTNANWGFREFILNKNEMESNYIMPAYSIEVNGTTYAEEEMKSDTYTSSWK